jgi:hypothetical protein
VEIRGCKHNGNWLFISDTDGCTFDNIRIIGNDITTARGAIKIAGDATTTIIKDLEIVGNRFTKTSNDTAPLVEIVERSLNGAYMGITRFEYSDNNHVHDILDTGTGYSITFRSLSVMNFNVKDNMITRGNFRNWNMNGCTINNGVVTGNMFDGSVFVENTPTATSLVGYVFANNVGSRYEVKIGDQGITKTRYVDSANAFTTYLP